MLSRAYPELLYRVLPEVKECDENGQRRQHLDLLLHDGDQPAYGFELVVAASQTEFDEHCEHSYYYSKLHDCDMYMVNLCDNTHLTSYFGEVYDHVMPVHVVYNTGAGSAKLLYRNNAETTIDIKGSEWRAVFA